jgi:predicted DNA-binding protein YlxM (UPF0122 family)
MMKKYVWVPISLIILIPFIVSTSIRHYQYYEYRKKKKEEILLQTHRKQIRELIRKEDELLLDLGRKLKSRIYNLVRTDKFDNFVKFYNEVKPIYSDLTNLQKIYKEKIKGFEIDNNIKKKISLLVINKFLIKAAKEYPEFKVVLNSLRFLKKCKEKDSFDIEEKFLNDIRNLSTPYLISIIKSNPKLVFVYNNLVDLYEYYKNKHSILEEKEQKLVENEKLFCKKVEKLVEDKLIIERIKTDHAMVIIYNSLIELYDHYKKKHELYRRMRELKHETRFANQF